ncbi:MAG: DUF4494 domain-containing protein [Bacteroidaceae bacterium]|nr:DUF4494 domain-containing protein [Bacteroidaceae bacterium]
MKEYIEANVKIDRMTSNGAMKQQRERYVVDAINFTEAERRLMEEVGAYGDGEFSVSDMKRVQYMEIFQTQDDSADKFFKVKISIITLDEESGKERRTAANLLVQASDIPNALERMRERMKGYMLDFDIATVADTKIMDVYHYKPKENPS